MLKGGNSGYKLKHHYSYALWEGYQQSVDDASLTINHQATTYGKSSRSFDLNGQLRSAIDAQTDSTGKSNTTYYINSGIDGLKARAIKTDKLPILP